MTTADLTPEQAAFRDKAVADAKAYGGDTALLLVASLAAGYGDEWADMDTWRIGTNAVPGHATMIKESGG